MRDAKRGTQLQIEWALISAVLSGNSTCVFHLLTSYPIEKYRRFSYNLLLMALNRQRHNVATTLLMFDVEVNNNQKDRPHNTPLHLAAMSGYYDLTLTLLLKNARISAMNDEFETPLHVACRSHWALRPFIVSLLLVSGAHVNAVSEFSMTPLIRAVEVGCLVTVKMLLHYKADITIKDADDNTVLHMAAARGNSHVAGILLTNGADAFVNDVNSTKHTALHHASMKGNAVVAKILMQYGANPNAQDSFLQTPLHSAAISGRLAVVYELLKGGCMSELRDSNMRTARSYAVQCNHWSIVFRIIRPNAPCSDIPESSEPKTPFVEVNLPKIISTCKCPKYLLSHT